MFHREICKALVVLVCLFPSVFAQKVLEKDFYKTISYHPFSTGLSFETMIKKKHGVMAEGNFAFNFLDKNLSYNAGLFYKIHYEQLKMKRRKSRKVTGAKLLYWGPLVKFISLKSSLIDESKNKYEYSAQYLLLGLHFGKKRIFRPGITIHTRVGLGFPVEISEFEWKVKPDANASLTEKLTRGLSAFDWSVSVGYSF